MSVFLLAVIFLIIFFLFVKKDTASGISITYPFNNALFPPEFPAPAFEWKSDIRDSSLWEITVIARNKKCLISHRVRQRNWTPKKSEWDCPKNQGNMQNSQEARLIQMYLKARR